jgi:fructose-bisphosphate aldolase, class I
VSLGKSVRLARIFSHPSGRLMSVAVDHFVGHSGTMQEGLHDLPRTIRVLVEGKPDAITMLKGVASACWTEHAGALPLIIQVGCFTLDDRIAEVLGGPSQVIRLGADAIAIAIGVRGLNEGRFLRYLSGVVDEAEPFGLPVIAHVYPRDFTDQPKVATDLDNISWAIRCAIECGADVVKVPYPEDITGFSDVISASPIPVLLAGGTRADTLEEALVQAQSGMAVGAAGVTVGRNIWGVENPQVAIRAFQGVVHDLMTPTLALSFARDGTPRSDGASAIARNIESL